MGVQGIFLAQLRRNLCGQFMIKTAMNVYLRQFP